MEHMTEKDWKAFEKVFNEAGLKDEEAGSRLPVGTFTNRQIAELVESPDALKQLLKTIPRGAQPLARRSALCTQIGICANQS